VVSTTTQPPAAPTATARRRKHTDRGADRGFRYLAVGAGVLILLVLAAGATFLVVQGMPDRKSVV
jgi:phosphate transport system permease protein